MIVFQSHSSLWQWLFMMSPCLPSLEYLTEKKAIEIQWFLFASFRKLAIFFFGWKQGMGWIRGGGQTVRRKSVFIRVGGDGSIERRLAWRGTYLSELNSRTILADSMNGRGGEKRWKREKIVGHGKKPEAKNPGELQATISQWTLLWKLMCFQPTAKRVSLFVFHLKYVQSRLAREQAEGFGEELDIKQAIELTRWIIHTLLRSLVSSSQD